MISKCYVSATILGTTRKEKRMDELIKIELSAEDCELFKLFQQYHEDFRTLVDSGLFNVRNGSVIVNFNPQGQLSTVEIHQNTYRRRQSV